MLKMIKCLPLLVLLATDPQTFAQYEPLYFKAEIRQQQRSLRATRPVKNLDDLINRLRAQRRKVRRSGKVSQPFFSVRGRIISVDGEQVQVFQYPKPRAADQEAKAIDPKGAAVGTSMPMWIAPPHFFKSGSIIVLYLGQSSSIIKALEGALGPQFAGK